MDNSRMNFDDYRKAVYSELSQYANFKSPDKEAQQYMESKAVNARIKKGYLKGDSAVTCAWAIDMLY